ncbi:hypothetical protein FEM48_Zijuj07G0160900 [Ziziphus jujuba var. spinosa]|uniref:Uncharacterized protein n=1 Tax=Ziziphus jujuba var. spinosa TaxID=714518 RepID=A0A978V5L4_ZIZJJ|nr:hypothetical protein FEM48_Zijuj07G0160900 [Ziziphus jujuba var. spinosa]
MLPQLEVVYLSSNPLGGQIPTSSCHCRNLKQLKPGGNGLSGSIPTKLGCLYEVEYLSINENQLTSTIPASLGNLSKLEFIDLLENNLSRNVLELTSSLFFKLIEMYFHGSQFRGGIGYGNEQGKSVVLISLGSSNICCALPMLRRTSSFPQNGVNESSYSVVNNGISVTSTPVTVSIGQSEYDLVPIENLQATSLSPTGYTTHNNDTILTSPTAQTTQNNGVTVSSSSTSSQSAQQFPSVSSSLDAFTNSNNVFDVQIFSSSNTHVVPLDLLLEAEIDKMLHQVTDTMTRATQKGC